MRVGVLINPIAGMGGAVGLKGTDGEETLRRARELGAEPLSAERMRRALNAADAYGWDIIAAPGAMGSDLLREMNLDHHDLGFDSVGGPEDTRRAAVMMEGLADLLLFSGGDGTARDIMDAVGGALPVLGVPAGVKMHSAVFAASPEAAGELLRAFAEGRVGETEAEVMDIDEDAFRLGSLDVRLHGYLRSLGDETLMPGSKGPSTGEDWEQREEIGQHVAESMAPGLLHLVGPGSTAKACMEAMGLPHSILGFDAVIDGRTVGKDLGSKEMMDLLDEHGRCAIVLGVIGGQGFFLGRGNQQLTPRIIERAGTDSLMVLCTPSKLDRVRVLRVDSGDPGLDRELRGRRRVIIGHRRERIVEVL